MGGDCCSRWKVTGASSAWIHPLPVLVLDSIAAAGHRLATDGHTSSCSNIMAEGPSLAGRCGHAVVCAFLPQHSGALPPRRARGCSCAGDGNPLYLDVRRDGFDYHLLG